MNRKVYFAEKYNLQSRIFFYLYLVLSALNILSHAIANEALEQYTKPALMPALLFFVYESSKGRVTMVILLLSLSIIFSWLGDISLMYEGEMFFLAGLGAFLIAHLSYSLLFLRSISFKVAVGYLRMVPVVGIAILFVYLLKPYTGAMTVPVAVYGIVISIMVGTALLREKRVGKNSFWLVVSGSFLFLFSDAVIGFTRFVSRFYCDECLIMGTYTVAQLLITLGVLEQNKSQSA